MRRHVAILGVFATALIALLALAPVATAEVPVESYGLLPSTTQAGGHPDLQIAFVLKTGKVQQAEEGLNSPCDCENPRFLTVHAPKGLVGNPHAAPTCTAAQFAALSCPVDSQVGVAEIGLQLNPAGSSPYMVAVYNMVPRTGEAGLLAFSAAGATIFEVFSSRTGGDYGLDTKISVPNLVTPRYTSQVLWGVPAAAKHDALRFKPNTPGSALLSTLCDDNDVPVTPGYFNIEGPISGPDSVTKLCSASIPSQFLLLGTSSNSPPTPFIENPTSCGDALQSHFDVLAYDDTTTHASAPFPATTGCDQLSFNPSLAAKPTTTAADTPAGVDVELTVPQFQSPTVPSPSEIRGTEMILPQGFTINPSAADGKSACGDDEARFGTEEQAQCPDTAKIGTLEIETALLPGPLPGYLYLGRPLPGNRYRVFLVADGFNVHVKLAGTIKPDSATGQVAVIFNDLPETPFQKFTLHIFGSERGALATPTKCGTYPIVTHFTPWDAVLGKQSSQTFFMIDRGPAGSPCPGAARPFSPAFQAGSSGNTAGAHSSFAVDVGRPDGDQFLTGVKVTTPLGFSASLKGIPYCPETAIAQLSNSLYAGLAELGAPICPASQIGTVTAGAGAGSKPFYAPGRVYLAGPYKGAPLSLLVVIPAVSGPYDLGNVTARAAIDVNPITARVTTTSDPLPQILEGIPLRTRSIRVDINRENFALNPTNCAPNAVEATITGDEGGVARRSSHFQVANCAVLPFAPKLSLVMKGGTTRTAHPALTATLTARRGDANIATSAVTLPHSEFLDNAHINAPCTRVQFAAEACPATSVIGSAKAETPLLDQPLAGPVYLRSSSNELPDVVADLRGQLDVVLVGRVTAVNGRIRTTFEGTPDVPVSTVTLSLLGGKKGLLVNSENICKKPQFAAVKMIGQNGRRAETTNRLRIPCGKAKKSKRTNRRGLPRAKAVR